jgi:asparagine synthase (glutamine-hydrolysing)
MKTGLYALVHLDKSPLDPADLSALGLPDDSTTEADSRVRARVCDAEDIDAADVAWHGGSCCYFLGEIEDPQATAIALQCEPRPAAIALAAMGRWGARMSDLLKGNWSLLYWDGPGEALWLGASRALRDRLYYSFDGRKVGVSGDTARLSALSWVGAGFDAQGIAFALANSNFRHGRAGRTVLKGIYELEPGFFHRFAADGSRLVVAHAPDVAINWQGGFDDAVAAIEQRLKKVVHETLARHEHVAVFLSGGLDSAVVARFLAEERLPGQRVVALTAAAPPGSERAEESELAADVAQAVGIEHQSVWPERGTLFLPATQPYRDGHLTLSPRHYLYTALFDAARSFGATAVFDGVGGEDSVSGHIRPDSFAERLRALVRWMRDNQRPWRGKSFRSDDVFFVRPSPRLLSMLSDDFASRPSAQMPRIWPRTAAAPMGLPSQYHKLWRSPTSVAGGGLRQLSPLRDRQLVRTVAGMPANFTSWQGQERALARALLVGHVPDHVSSQSKGLSFSVDYDDRFRAEMPQIIERLPAWRNAGAGDWLDLDWLEREVASLMTQPSASVTTQFQIQLTALAAEYFLAQDQAGAMKG